MSLFSKPDLERKLQEAEEEIRVLKARLEEFSRHNARGAGRKGRMTESDKKAIARFRSDGLSYNRIAKELNLPVGTVFKYGKSLENSQENLGERIKKITRVIEQNGLSDQNSVNFSNFVEKTKYRNIMNNLQTKTK